MTEYIVKRWCRFDNFVALFATKLTKPAKRHLLHLLIALIIFDGRKNLAGLNRALFAPTHTSSLSRFISEASWDEAEFEQIRVEELSRHVQRWLAHHKAKNQKLPAFLCIDDTNNPKTGTKTAWTSYQYSHLAGGAIRCFCLVTALVVIGPWKIPLDFQLYRKKAECFQTGQAQLFVSKVDLAVGLIEGWQPLEGLEPVVLVDSWYLSESVIKACKARHFSLIGGVKANRAFSPSPNAKPRPLDELAPQLPWQSYHLVTVGRHKQAFRVAEVVGQLKEGGAIKLVVSRSLNGVGAVKTLAYRYLICTNLALSLETICEFYSVRWEIEIFHAQLKELLGFDHNQCWHQGNVRRLWRLVLMAYSYLVLEQVEQNELYTGGQAVQASLGQVVSWHRREAHRAEAEWVYAQAKAGLPLEAVLAQFAA